MQEKKDTILKFAKMTIENFDVMVIYKYLLKKVKESENAQKKMKVLETLLEKEMIDRLCAETYKEVKSKTNESFYKEMNYFFIREIIRMILKSNKESKNAFDVELSYVKNKITNDLKLKF